MPSNQEAEIAVLGGILLEGNEVYEKAKSWIKDDEAFYFMRHQIIWQAIGTLYKSNTPIDVVTIHTELKKKDKYDTEHVADLNAYFLTGLADGVPTTANVEHYAKDIWYKHIQRLAIKSAQKLYAMSLTDKEDVLDILHKHEKIIEELKESAPSKKVETEDIIDNTIETLKTGSNLIPFGIEQMDNAAGGMTRSEVTVVGGRPGHGKTTLVINIVKRLLEQGFRVMLFNREMTNVEMMKKILVMEFQEFSYEKIRKAENIEKEIAEISMKKEALGEKYKNLIMHDDCKTLADAMKEISREKPDVILDDYLQLIRTDNSNNKDRRFEIEDIMLDYKWICKKINCSAILVSQLNREIGLGVFHKLNLSARLDRPDSTIIIDTRYDTVNLEIKSIFIEGKYNKFDRTIPQTHWPCRKCKGRGCKSCNNTGQLYPDSVQSLVAAPLMKITNSTENLFHGMGREDIDAAMLGFGRPFVLELRMPKNREINLDEVQKKINADNEERIQVNNLEFVPRSRVAELKNTVCEKSYRVDVSIPKELTI